MKCFSADVCIYSIFCAFLIAMTVLVLFLTDCHDSTCVFSDSHVDTDVCITL